MNFLIPFLILQFTDMNTIFSNMKRYGKTLAIAIAEGVGLIENNSSLENPYLYYVQCGAFNKKENAEKLINLLSNSGYKSFLKKENGLYKIQVGAYTIESNAYNLADKLKEDGFDCFVTK